MHIIWVVYGTIRHDHHPNHDFGRLAKEAAAEGLLEPGAFEAILRERLAAIRVGKMQAARQKMVSAAVPPMAAKEIEAEIKAYRAER